MEPFSKKPRAPRKKFRTVSFGWIMPNMLTIGGLVSGLTAFRFALDQNWSLVVAMVSLAAIFDALDGRMARLLKTTSVFGAELDSLSDAIVFGVIPALCLYLWALEDSGNIAWGTALFYVVCIILRLARFNSELPDRPDYAKSFFTGIPAPAAGFLALLPIVALQVIDAPLLREPVVVSAVLVLIGVGAVSTMPTFSGKTLSVSSGAVLPFLAMVALFGSLVAIQPWTAYLGLAALYVVSFPFSVWFFYHRRRRHLKMSAKSDK